MNFLSKLHKNSILTGSVDSYCLICDNYLRSEDEAFVHLEKPIHKKNMGAAVCVEKYILDRIIKVKKGYYCPFCNILLTTTTKVGLHINEPKHKENRTSYVEICRVGDSIVAFDEVLISREAWHGFEENTCAICNLEFEKKELHISDLGHILKLIQSKCEFGDKYVYRKVDEDSFFCLICGTVLAIDSKPNHHEENTHKASYNSGVDLKNKITITAPKVKETTNEVPPRSKVENDKILKSNETMKTADPAKLIEVKALETNNFNGADTKRAVNNTTKIDSNATVEAEVVTEKAKIATPQKIEITAKKAETITPKNNATAKTSTTEESASKVPKDNTKNNTTNNNLDEEFFMADQFGKRCSLCDIICIREEDIFRHKQDRHHQMMVKKRRANDYKKEAIARPEKKTPIFEKTPIVEETPIVEQISTFEKTPVQISKPIEINQLKTVKQNGTISEEVTKSKLKTTAENHPKTINQKKMSSIETDDRSKMLETLEKYQKNNINIDFALDRANCRRCQANLEFKCSALDQHIEDHKKVKPKTKQPKEVSDMTQLINFTRDNSIEIMQDKALCKQCKITIKLNLKELKAHVISNSHMEKTLNKTELKKLVLAKDFMKTITVMESKFGTEIIVNDTYVLRNASFHCISMENDELKCLLCDIVFKEGGDQLRQHYNTVEHKYKIERCLVLSIADEYMREILPDVFHCGYCNVVTGTADSIEDHLTTSSHLNARRHSLWSLARCNAMTRSVQPVHISHLDAVTYK